MAKKNKQRKKRLKKYLKKLSKQVNKQSAIKEAVAVEDRYIPPYKEPIVYNIHEDYEEQKWLYQSRLNRKFNGTVTAIETFTNYQSIILHECSFCKKEFYARPEWLLTKPNQDHICGVDTVRMDTKKVKKRITEHDIIQMTIMHQQGMSQTKIATKLGVSRPTVISHLRKAGLL